MQQPEAVPPAVSESLADRPAERILLGHVTGIHGLKGWVKIHSDTNPRENIVKFPSWWLEQTSQWSQIKVLNGRPQGKTIIAQLEGISTPEQAGGLIGAKIAVDRSVLPQAGPGEYYWTDLIAMQVRTVDNLMVGRVDRLFETGANDVLVVADERHGHESGKEVLVPWLVPDVITDIDMTNRVITIDWDPDF